MPWHIENNNADCDGYAVVKDGGDVVGCHKTRSAALRQLAALNIAEPEYSEQSRDIRADSYTPTAAMRSEARQGLEWRQEFGRGGTAVGVARARDIINGDLSFDTVKRMSSYFARHLVDKDAEGFRAGEEGFPSAGRIAWALWGGDAGRAWALAIIVDNKTRAMDDASTLAPKSDQIEGSKANPSGSASGKSGDIELSASVEKSLVNKASEHNDMMKTDGKPDWTRVTVGALRSVYRRGAGAFSTSHRPGMTRGQWAMGRVNAFLYLARTGGPENAKYVGDNDLLNRDHPKYSEKKETNNMDLNELETRDGELGDLGFTPRQVMQYENDEKVVDLFGYYTQDSSANGAHYMAESPFVAEGLVCSSCAFYNGARACEIVEGDIAPEGICKRWIIPDRLIVSDTVETEMEMNETYEPAVRYDALEIQHRKVQGRDVEFRTVSFGNIEVRSDMEGQPMRFRGYAAVFNSPSEPLPFIETIRPGAFKRSLKSGREVRMFVNHNTDLVLGSTRSGTITVTEDSRGLLVEGELPDTTYARDLSALMQRGDVHGMSFGFSVPRGGDMYTENGAQRMLTEVILHEVSVVTGFPAYPETSGATVRNTETETHIDETPASTVPVAVARRMNDLYAKKA
jgi:HK97 family phage prohead protease